MSATEGGPARSLPSGLRRRTRWHPQPRLHRAHRTLCGWVLGSSSGSQERPEDVCVGGAEGTAHSFLLSETLKSHESLPT